MGALSEIASVPHAFLVGGSWGCWVLGGVRDES